jgi:GTP-binding protein
MQQQTARALEEADVALFVVDARAGITPLDRHFADWLRRAETPIILVANKAEGRAGDGGVLEAYELGLGEPVVISAEHGEGLAELYAAVAPFAENAEEAGPAPATPERPLQLAVVGRPNVGKSTLINRLLGDERVLTGPEAGTTRDAVATAWRWQGRAVRLIDTAGMRRRAKVEEKLEKLSVGDALRAIRFAEAVVLVVDAVAGLEKQDLTIAELVEDEGRALVLAVNKWDLVENKSAASRLIRDRLERSLPQLSGVPVVALSARSGAGVAKLMPAVLACHAAWNKRIATPVLNRWLAHLQERHPPPLVSGRRLRLRYMTQVNTRPPTFALFASKPGDLPEAYRRYLVNLMREEFDLPGVPIRVMLRKGENPYGGKD